MNCVLDLLWFWIEKRKRRQQMREVSHCVWLLQWVIFCSKPNSNLNRSNKKNLHLPISCLNNVIEESGGNLNFEFFSEKLCLDMKPSWLFTARNKYSTFQNYDTKKETKKAGIKAKGHPRSRFFCVCKHIVKMLPLTKFQLIWSKIVHFRGKWKICPILKEKWAIFQPNDTEVVLTFLGQIEPWYFKA